MKKMFILKITLSFLLLIFLLPCGQIKADENDYVIENFQSKITINKNTSLTIEEILKVNFFVPKHGIFRIIPLTYSSEGKTIQSRFKIIGVYDERGKPYKYQVSDYKKSIKIKIGDPEKVIEGQHTYILKYNIQKVIVRYAEHDEVYWNVTGHEWDTVIKKASAEVFSPFAEIKKIDCFAGLLKTQEKKCKVNFSSNQAFFFTTISLDWNKSLTIVTALNKDNHLQFPGTAEKIRDLLTDNWAYPLALMPLIIIFVFWHKKGRDRKYLRNNIYYQPDNKKTVAVSFFDRKHLPLVYSPINNLTPSEIGVIIDEKADIEDVVAEIVELARLGYLKIERVENKEFLRKKINYHFQKINKDAAGLEKHQKYLLEALFTLGAGLKKDDVFLSELKNRFYIHLDDFKRKLYNNLIIKEIFPDNPERIRKKWGGIFAFLTIFSSVFLFFFAFSTDNFGPLIFNMLTVVPAIFLIKNMPRRTTWGYSLLQQIIGLRYYLEKGKWREEIYEKHLFLEEILPLAICLKIVNKLSRQMADLGVEPPSYFTGADMKNFSSGFNHFYEKSTDSFLSSPRNSWSGSSSWSGGSGFSSGGGSSGGGFGGGGGGSW